ncbi:MAG: DUF3857 domain-containing protein [Povalibacter sp.]
MKRVMRFPGRVCGVGLLLMFCCGLAQADWLPIAADELALKADPLAPKASAEYLYRQVDRDDEIGSVRIYKRVKILTEEGREYANVKIVYNNRRQRVSGIEARTIRPDGSIVEFTGKPFDQSLVKGKGKEFSAKLFTLSDVQVGSIIEYRYSLFLDRDYVFDSNWVLNDDLFTKHAKFSLIPNTHFTVRWSWPLGLPAETDVPKSSRGKIQMETSNVEAFVEEEYMPPESAVRMRVEFSYVEPGATQKDADSYWKHYENRTHDKFEDFINYRPVLQATVKPLIAAGDSPEIVASKLYVWVQGLRNISFERRKSDEENKREDLDANDNVKDVLKHGYGSGDEINRLYVGLARAAGLEAYLVEVSTRDQYFFSKAMCDSNQLNTTVVQLRINGQDMYLDPGTAFVPFGLLPWSETMVAGLRLDGKGGTWINTPAPTAAQGLIQRSATLQLGDSGELEGKLKVTFNGLAALTLRLDGRFDDATERKETLEDLVKSYVPLGIEVTLANEPDWRSASQTMTAEFDLKIPGWMQSSGSRAFLPAALFGGEFQHEFDHAIRHHPVYFRYSYERDDDVTIKLPASWHVGTLAPAQNNDLKNLIYAMASEELDGALHLKRHVVQRFVFLQTKYYDQLRDFFQQVRAGDEQQVILLPVAAKKH